MKIQYFLLTFIYLSVAIFGYLTFYDNPMIKTENLFAFDIEKSFYFVMTNFLVAFSVLFSMIVTFKPTKDLILNYLDTSDL